MAGYESQEMEDDDSERGLEHKFPLIEAPLSQVEPVPVGPVGVYDWTLDWETTKGEFRVEHEFALAGLNWRFLLFPIGCDRGGWLGIFMLPLLKPGQEIRIQYAFELRGPNEMWARRNTGGYDLFTIAEDGRTIQDRGFHQLLPSAMISEKVAAEGALTIRFEIMEMHASAKPGCEKAILGFVGLRNQGATCYMNSLLQTLYALPSFRKAVFNIAFEEKNEDAKEEKKDSATNGTKPGMPIAIALQKVFYKLQTSEVAVSTKVLTKSFGWTSMDSAMQHDVQEFSRVLLDSLEDKTKGTTLENIVPSLFQGETESFVRCLKVDFTSKRAEKFYDLALNVKGCASLEKSFEQYLATETLTGTNQFRAEKFGLQDAVKGITFLTLPPVLQLQLKRFEYDMYSGRLTKVNEFLEFPVTLDMSKYCPEASAPYHLHSVLVHSGGAYGGHYYCFIRPIGITGSDYSKAGWFKFDDSRVTPATQAQAVRENFGGGVYSFANAYMLVYVREEYTTFEEASVPIPQSLADTMTANKQRKEETKRKLEDEKKRKQSQTEASFTYEVELVGRRMGLGLEWERPLPVPKELPSDPCLFDPLFDRTQSEAGTVTSIDCSCTLDTWLKNTEFVDAKKERYKPQVWSFKNRENMTERPLRPTDVTLRFDSYSLAPRRFFVRDSTHDLDVKTEMRMLILKYFDIPHQCLRLLGSVMQTHKSAPFDVAAQLLMQQGYIKQLPPGKAVTWLSAFEEETDTKILPILEDEEVDMRSGDIIVFERRLSEPQLKSCKEKHEAKYRNWLQKVTSAPEGDAVNIHLPGSQIDSMRSPFFASCREFLPFLASRLLIQLNFKGQEPDARTLMLQRTLSYTDLVTVLGKWLNVEPLKIRIFSSEHSSSYFEATTPKNLGDMCNCSCGYFHCDAPTTGKCSQQTRPPKCVLWVDVAEFSFEELARCEVVEVHFMENFDTTSFKLLVPKKGTAEDVLQALRQKLSLGPGAGQKRKAPQEDRPLLLLSVLTSQRRVKLCNPADSVDLGKRYGDNWAFVAQYASPVSPDSKVVWLWRYSREYGYVKIFEYPMQVVTRKTQTIAELKTELQAQLHKDKVNLKYMSYGNPTDLEDDRLVWDLKLKTAESNDIMDGDLVMEAPVQAKKSTTNYNRGVKFYN